MINGHTRTAATTAAEGWQKTTPDRLVRPTRSITTKNVTANARLNLRTPGREPLSISLARGRSTVLRSRHTYSAVAPLIMEGHRQRDMHLAMLTTLQHNVRATLIKDIRLAMKVTRVKRNILASRPPDKRPQAPVRVALHQRTRYVQVEELITPAELTALLAEHTLGQIIAQHRAKLPHSTARPAADSSGREVHRSRTNDKATQAREVRRIRPPSTSEIVSHPIAPPRHGLIRTESEHEVLSL